MIFYQYLYITPPPFQNQQTNVLKITMTLTQMPRAVGWGKGGKGVNLRVNHMYICTCLPPVNINFSYQYILDQLYTFIHSCVPAQSDVFINSCLQISNHRLSQQLYSESCTSRNNRDQLGVIYFSWMYVNAYDFDISSILIKSWILAKNCTSSNKCYIHHKQVHAFMYGTSIYMKITATNFQLI